jgi:hypothetical protein
MKNARDACRYPHRQKHVLHSFGEVAGKHLLAATDFVLKIILRIFKGSVLIQVEK